MERIRGNSGFVDKTSEGFKGRISIEGVEFDIECTFWRDADGKRMIWVRRQKEAVFNPLDETFTEYKAKPSFECCAKARGEGSANRYKGEFMFIGFKYSLDAWFEDRLEKRMDISIERNASQPIISRLNEIRMKGNEREENND